MENLFKLLLVECETIWGRTCKSLTERPHSFFDAIHPDDRPRVLASIQANSYIPKATIRDLVCLMASRAFKARFINTWLIWPGSRAGAGADYRPKLWALAGPSTIHSHVVIGWPVLLSVPNEAQ